MISTFSRAQQIFIGAEVKSQQRRGYVLQNTNSKRIGRQNTMDLPDWLRLSDIFTYVPKEIVL